MSCRVPATRGSLAWRLPRRREGETHHLVGENTVDTVVVKSHHPVESLNLVVSHLAALDVCESGLERRRRRGGKRGTHKAGFR